MNEQEKRIQDAIKDFEHFKKMGYGHCDLPSSGNIEIAIESMRDKVAALESPSGWIPCSELLPDHSDSERAKPCIVTAVVGFPPMRYSFPANHIKTKSREYWQGSDGKEIDLVEIIAWQPLPEPYQGEA